MSSDMRDAMRRLESVYYPHRTHAADPVACTRKDSDSTPPAGCDQGYGTRDNTNVNVRNGGRNATRGRKVTRDERAGAAMITPPTSRVSAPRMAHAEPGQRVTRGETYTINGKRVYYPSGDELKARKAGEQEQWRAWAMMRRATLETLGEMLTHNTAYPIGLRKRTVQGQQRVTLAVSPAGKETTYTMAEYADYLSYEAWVRAGRPVADDIKGFILGE